MHHIPEIDDTNYSPRIILGNQDVIGHQIIMYDLSPQSWYPGKHIQIEAIEEICGQVALADIADMRQILSQLRGILQIPQQFIISSRVKETS